MKYQAYADYKDSGVEWLGQVPKHWNVVSIKYLARFVGTGGTPKEETSFSEINDVHWFTPVDFNGDGVLSKSSKYITDISCKKGDAKLYHGGSVLVIGIGATLGKVGLCLNSFSCNQQINIITPNEKIVGMFMMNSLSVQLEQMKQLSNASTIGIMNQEKTKLIKITIPPVSEQQTIDNFLHHETAKIDILIEKQQQLIKLLKEKRQAVISNAVTKGLNPNAPLRDSGVEWLGEVPEHWTLPKIKWFFKTESGGTPNTSKFETYYQDGDIPWIRTTDLNNSELFETPILITKQAVIDSACSLLPKNTVLVAMYGGAGSIGMHAILKFVSTINQAVCAILPNEKIDPNFLHLYVEFYRQYWMVGAEGTRKDPNINQETIRDLMISCPPLYEQIEIIRITKDKLLVIDEVTSKSEVNIELMQERRTALISAAVTGKIDVRHWNGEMV